MNSLKKKFGKFAVSSEKMAKVSGGSDADTLNVYDPGEPKSFTCWEKNGTPYGLNSDGTLGSLFTQSVAESLVNSGAVDGCSN